MADTIIQGMDSSGVVFFYAGIRAKFIPKPDITAYELSLILPYIFGQVLYKDAFEKLGDAKRHLEIIDG